MRRILAAIAVLVLSVCVCQFVEGQQIKPPKTEQKLVRVPGNQGWVDTGIKITRKDRVKIQATGKVYFSNGASDSGVGPLGWSRSNYQEAWPNDWITCDDPLPSAGHAGLLVKVGGEEMFAGNNKMIQRMEGRLYLGINDCTLKGAYYNSGQFNVVIKVERGVIR